ncbi:ECF transporter S component [Oenococcus oeni]|uniref:ECF transporter S component n=1 Tax=Oenococcus oeni TaxID=1247 RepID=UPI00050E47D5|nr:ECF transporter S component [Oenococcus oeni]KGI05988.1 riboflavin transporter RibU [Oenococcus oeni IOEB_L40_4]
MIESRKKLRILMIAVLFSAVSFILMIFPQVPIIPGASFLKLELSIIPLLLLAHFFGIRYGLLGVLLRSVLHLILLNQGVITWIGLPINIVAVIVYMLILSYLRRKNVWLAIIASTIALTLVEIFANIFFALPLYAEFMNYNIGKIIGLGKYILLMVLPFNLIEGLVWGFVYYPIEKIFEKIFPKQL